MKKLTVKCPKCKGEGQKILENKGDFSIGQTCDLCQGEGKLVLEVLKEEDDD